MKGIKTFGELYLDLDTDPKINKGSDYILNHIVTDDERYGIGVNCKGNRAILAPESGYTYKFWGQCEDNQLDRIIIFYTEIFTTSSTTVTDIIAYVDITTGNLTTIFSTTTLLGWSGLVSGSPIFYISAIEAFATGGYLVFNDGVNPIREINYARMLNGGYATIDAEVIKLYKKPTNYNTSNTPIIVPAQYTTYPGSVIPEFPYGLINKSYQWATRLIYTDNQKSVISQITDIQWTSNNVYPNGQQAIENNVLSYTLTLPSLPNDVSYVEILVRKNEELDWYSYDTIASYSGISTYVFDDTKVWVPVDQGELDRPYDYIPPVIKHIRGIEDNRALISNYTEGFDPVSFNSNDVSIQVIPAAVNTNINSYLGSVFYASGDPPAGPFYLVAPRHPLHVFILPSGGFEAVLQFMILITTEAGSDANSGILSYRDTINIRYTNITGISSQGTTTVTDLVNDIYSFFITKLQNGTTGTPLIEGYTNSNPSGVVYVPNTLDTTTPSCLQINLLSSFLNDVTTFATSGNAFWANFIANTKLPSSGTVNFSNFNLQIFPYFQSYKTLKDNDNYLGGIVYYDKDLRYSTVNRFPSAIQVSNTLSQNNLSRYQFQVTIYKLPPIWAFYYSLAFTKSQNKGYRVQFMAQQLLDYIFGSDGFLLIKLQSIIDWGIKNNQATLPSYDFETGDKIRVIGLMSSVANGSWPAFVPCYIGNGTTTNPTSSVTDTVVTGTFPNTFDVPVLGSQYADQDASYAKDYTGYPNSGDAAYILDANGNKIFDTNEQYIKVGYRESDQIINPVDGKLYPLSDSTQLYYLIFEIYRPAETSPTQFYYHDNLFPILNPGTAHAYHGTNPGDENIPQSASVAATIGSNFGDTYLKVRDCKYVFACEDDNFSDYYESEYYGLGAPNVYDQYQKQQSYPNGLRFGGKLILQTKVNELNKFLAEDNVLLKLEYGEITSLNEVGDVLKVLHRQEETSIYIGRTETMNADGTKNLITSDNVLGTINYLSFGNGTIFPRSVVEYERDIYYLDVYNAEVIRSGANGRDAISKYGMKTFFKNVSQIILANVSNYDVEGGYDVYNKIYYLTIFNINPSVAPFTINGALVNGFTAGYYDPKDGKPGRWFYYSFIPNLYANLGEYLLTFNTNGIWVQNDASVARCNFFGVQYPWVINFYFNDNPIQQKVLKTLGIKSSSPWNVNSIDIESTPNHPNGMHSFLDPLKFKLREDQYCGAYLKNQLTHQSSPSTLDLIKGDALRGFYVKHQIINNSTTEQWIVDAEIVYDISDKI